VFEQVYKFILKLCKLEDSGRQNKPTLDFSFPGGDCNWGVCSVF